MAKLLGQIYEATCDILPTAEGFYSDTVLSLSQKMLYDLTENQFLLSIFPAIVILSLIPSVWIIYSHWKNNSEDRIHRISLFVLILVGPILGSILLHYWLEKPSALLTALSIPKYQWESTRTTHHSK